MSYYLGGTIVLGPVVANTLRPVRGQCVGACERPMLSCLQEANVLVPARGRRFRAWERPICLGL